jgi:gamma-glutamylcyclotransferase (GGCT)/AIG2-like uncharacterized protein YtfP
MPVTYYFAYGSNMSHLQMRQRCPSSKFLKRAYLRKHKLVFDGYSTNWKGAVANVVEWPNETVCGGVFEINEDNLAALDCYEGYPERYNRRQVTLKDDEGKKFKGFLYCRPLRELGRPSRDYLNKIIGGAKDCGLPEEYIDKILKEGVLKESRNDS